MIQRAWLGLSGGLVAGAAVGLAEALFVLGAGAYASEYAALFYAVVIYSALGAAAGAAVGVALGVLRAVAGERPDEPMIWTLSFLAAAGVVGGQVAWTVATERLWPGQPLGSNVQVLGLTAGAGLALIGLWLGPLFLTQTPLKILLRPRGTAALYLSWVGFAAIFAFAPTREGPAGSMRPGRPQPQEFSRHPNVLVIVVGSLRADALGVYNPRERTDPPRSPHIDALAERGVVFERAFAASTDDHAAAASLLSGLTPTAHGASAHAALPYEAETLPEVLSGFGYVTGAVPNGLSFAGAGGMRQGFDWFEYMAPDGLIQATESASQLAVYGAMRAARERATDFQRVEDYYQPADVVLNRGQDFIAAQHHERWFLLVHLAEPTAPWFSHPDTGAAHTPGDGALVETLRDAYAGEVRWMDAQLGLFFQWMESRDLYEDALIVLTSDHGLEFLEHGGWGSGDALFDEQLQIPLIVKLPRSAHAGERVPWQVRAIDVAPTVVERAGFPLQAPWPGRSLFEPGFENGLEDRPVLAESGAGPGALAALRIGGWKLVRAAADHPRGLPPVSLFHVAADPGERRDLAASAGSELTRLDAMLFESVRRAAHDRPGAMAEESEAIIQKRLHTLGYVE